MIYGRMSRIFPSYSRLGYQPVASPSLFFYVWLVNMTWKVHISVWNCEPYLILPPQILWRQRFALPEPQPQSQPDMMSVMFHLTVSGGGLCYTCHQQHNWYSGKYKRLTQTRWTLESGTSKLSLYNWLHGFRNECAFFQIRLSQKLGLPTRASWMVTAKFGMTLAYRGSRSSPWTQELQKFSRLPEGSW